MKRRRLNKKGKTLLSLINFIISAVIYVLMAKFGAKGTEGIIYQLALILGWIWLFFGQFSIYYFIWNCEVQF